MFIYFRPIRKEKALPCMIIRYIKSDNELNNVISEIQNNKEIAIDLEFDKNRYHYGFNLCLVQICTGNECMLIDPLDDQIHIDNLFPLFESKDIQKIVFAFGEDLRLLHSLGCYPKNIYDLAIAASLLNYPQKSLSDFISDLLEIETVKSTQQSNWYKRPLTDLQKQYAAQDVFYLSNLKKVLERQATEKRISNWIDEENSMFEMVDYSDLEDNNFLKDNDKNGMSEFAWFVFCKLMELREKTAEQFNKPSYQILNKKYLAEIAKENSTIKNWTNKRGIFRGIKTDSFRIRIEKLLEECSREATKLGLSKNKPAYKPPSKEEAKAEREERRKANKLKNEIFLPVKQKIAEDYGKETASYIFSNRIISNILADNDCGLEYYKKKLLQDYADELGLDISPIHELVND